MSPESDLLDHLLGSDICLDIARQIFNVSGNQINFERAKRAIKMQAQNAEVQIIFKANGKERLLENWEIDGVLRDENNWLLTNGEASYFLRITNKGARRVGI